MIDEINKILPNHTITFSEANNIYIVDYKDLNIGDVELLEVEPSEIKYVYLENKIPIKIAFDGFKDNALPISVGNYNSQCECVIFPASDNENDWILFIEMKYANNLKAALSEKADYPNSMIEQIIETVNYFRIKEIIEPNRRVNAIVSFPNLIEEFSAYFFRDKIDELLLEHKILIRATNSALIKSEKRITLNSI